MRQTKFLAFISVLLSAVLAFSACGEGNDSSGGGSDGPKELEAGVIIYENATCESIINQENSGTVATAIATNGATVTYTLKDETELNKLNNAFGGAISIALDGTILGSYDTAGRRIKVKITARAEKCEDVTAEITVSVVNPHLKYSGRQLADARQGVYYAASVAYVEDDVAATYRLTEGELPAGLSFETDGTITGVPTEVGRGKPFKVTAKGAKYSDSVATFSIDVVIDHHSDMPSTIVNFGDKQGEKVLTEAYAGSQYVNQSGVAGKASALNDNNVTYRLAETEELPDDLPDNFADALPAGIKLYSNGAIIGMCEEPVSEIVFYVVASADGCPDVIKGFRFSVMAKRVHYEFSGRIELTKGEAASVSLATADAGEEVAITYSVEDADSLSANYGLSVTEAGMLIGTPTKVEELISFKVTASAEGFTPTQVTVYARLNEPLQAPANGRFEAEYTDLNGKSGTGYSASPTGKDIIDAMQDNDALNISNGAFVNYMHNSSITLEFVVYAEEAVSNAKLFIQMSSEMGTVTLTPSSFGVYTYAGKTTDGAKTTVNYGSVRINGNDMTYAPFAEYQFGTVNLAKGWNVIQLAVHENDYRGAGVTGGPGVDYIRIETSVSVKWVPCSYNFIKG